MSTKQKGLTGSQLKASKLWQDVVYDPGKARALADELSIPFPIAATLIGRGYGDAAALKRFLNPRLADMSDPYDLPSMEEAVERIWKAIDAKERILVHGDYDVDGMSSTALLVRILRELGGDAVPFLPQRIEEGYGLSMDGLKRCVETHQPQLIITVDCGTGSAEAVEAATGMGVDVVITDHHEPGAVVAPAYAVVNPKLKEESSLHDLAGVGVTFKLGHALIKKARETGREGAAQIDLRPYLELVALGTVTDIVPLLDENRIMVRHGLERLSASKSVGLSALIDIAKIRGPLQSYHIGYQLGPRLNAAGRIGDANAALDLLLTEDAAAALETATHLDVVNRERRTIESKILEEAIEQVDGSFVPDEDCAVVVAGEGWHPGVVGIVASRLVERYYRPTIVIGFDENEQGRGSCRSIDGFDLVKHLDRCSDFLLQYGGHTMAAGLELEKSAFPEFMARFKEVAASSLAGKTLQPKMKIDAWIELDEVNEHLFGSLEQLRPFGYKNPRPTWATKGLEVAGEPRIVGDKHLKMTLASKGARIEAIGFGLGERELPEGPVDVAFHIQKNEFRGRTSIELVIHDFRPAEGS